MDILEYNREAWNQQAAGDCEWSIPVGPEIIRAARQGDWSVILTPTVPVPRDWFGDLAGQDVLCLASAGGQQAPVFAAAGARVVSYDLSDAQLEKDQQVAQREGLTIRCWRGPMADLSAFGDSSFDLVFHPISNLFAPDIRGVWRECFRVLRPGGALLSGFMNPDFYLFDHEALAQGAEPVVRFQLPYADTTSLSAEAHQRWLASGRPLEFGHTLQDQIGGQLAAGFVLTGFYEDSWHTAATPLSRFFPVSMATRALKPGSPVRA